MLFFHLIHSCCDFMLACSVILYLHQQVFKYYTHMSKTNTAGYWLIHYDQLNTENTKQYIKYILKTK